LGDGAKNSDVKFILAMDLHQRIFGARKILIIIRWLAVTAQEHRFRNFHLFQDFRSRSFTFHLGCACMRDCNFHDTKPQNYLLTSLQQDAMRVQCFISNEVRVVTFAQRRKNVCTDADHSNEHCRKAIVFLRCGVND